LKFLSMHPKPWSDIVSASALNAIVGIPFIVSNERKTLGSPY
jgi:hypothetical protein